LNYIKYWYHKTKTEIDGIIVVEFNELMDEEILGTGVKNDGQTIEAAVIYALSIERFEAECLPPLDAIAGISPQWYCYVAGIQSNFGE